MEQKPTFESSWPTLEPQLRRSLAARGVPFDAREDILQETALRLLRCWHRVRPESLWAFALTVALNIVRDEARARDRRERVLPDDHPHDRDPEHEALVRMELDRVRTALASMTPRQQTILLSEIGEAANEEEPGAALKMARMRARRRLRTLIEGASAFVPMQLGRARRWLHDLESGAANTAAALAVQLTAVAAVSAISLPTIIDRPALADLAPAERSAHVAERDLDGESGRERRVARTQSATRRLGHDGRPQRIRTHRQHSKLNQHFGVVHKDDDTITIEDEAQIGPYGADHGFTQNILGSEARGSLKARYRAARCTNEFLEHQHSPCGDPGRGRGRFRARFEEHERDIDVRTGRPVQ